MSHICLNVKHKDINIMKTKYYNRKKSKTKAIQMIDDFSHPPTDKEIATAIAARDNTVLTSITNE